MKNKRYLVKKITRRNTETDLNEFQIQVTRSLKFIIDSFGSKFSPFPKLVWLSERYDFSEKGNKECETDYQLIKNTVKHANLGFLSFDDLLDLLDKKTVYLFSSLK